MEKIKRRQLSVGQKSADRITAIVGSWKFLIFQSLLLLVWLALNITAWMNHWDPYPFILLNLILSFQAAYTAPVILMSNNRMAEKDRHKAEMDFAMDKKAEKEIKEIQIKLEIIDAKIEKIFQAVSKDRK